MLHAHTVPGSRKIGNLGPKRHKAKGNLGQVGLDWCRLGECLLAAILTSGLTLTWGVFLSSCTLMGMQHRPPTCQKMRSSDGHCPPYSSPTTACSVLKGWFGRWLQGHLWGNKERNRPWALGKGNKWVSRPQAYHRETKWLRRYPTTFVSKSHTAILTQSWLFAGG